MNRQGQEAVEQKALELFRLLHGPGDSGSEFAFSCQNGAVADGWMRVARLFLRLEMDVMRTAYLDELIRTCPHTVITFNDDPDVEGVPAGFSITTEGCEKIVSVGRTLREAVDKDMKRHASAAKKT